jgi:hypothetical protein
LDYDNNKNIGPLDILNLRKSFDNEELEKINKIFLE